MNSSYKIALLVAIVLCGLILGYYLTRDSQEALPNVQAGPDVAITDNPVVNDPQPMSRPSLRDNPPSVPPPPAATIGTGSVPPPPPASGSSLMDQVNQHTQGSTSSSSDVPPAITSIDTGMNNTNTRPSTPIDARSLSTDSRPSTPTATTTTTPSTPVNTNPNNIPDTGRGSLVHNTPTAGKTYTIKAGDTFSSIARETLGSESKYYLIAEANPYIEPRRLKVGQVIRIPSADGTISPGSPASTPATKGAGPAEYTVQSGDTLSKIARTYYGDPNLWEVIHLANRAKIGSDPSGIKPGMTLFIPPEPRAAH